MSLWILQFWPIALENLGALGLVAHLSLLQVSLAHNHIFVYFYACRHRNNWSETDQKLNKTLNWVFFKRKVHTFGKKQQPKSKKWSETSAKSERGDTGLSNGTGLTNKLTRSTENGRFEVWNLSFYGIHMHEAPLGTAFMHKLMYLPVNA